MQNLIKDSVKNITACDSLSEHQSYVDSKSAKISDILLDDENFIDGLTKKVVSVLMNNNEFKKMLEKNFDGKVKTEEVKYKFHLQELECKVEAQEQYIPDVTA